MSIPDLINGSFELTGGFVILLNVRRLLRDRRVEGVDWRVFAFMSAWGFWNLFYYPSLHQWASFAGGLLLAIVNTTWVILALRTIAWNRHMKHKAFEPSCRLCREAVYERLINLCDTAKCQCDICVDADKGNIS